MVAPVTIDFGANANPLIKEVERIKNEIKGLDAGSKDFNNNYKRLMAEASMATKQYNAALKDSAKFSQEANASIGGLSVGLGTIAAVGATLTGAFTGILELANRADDIADLADGLGITATELQSLSGAAALSGVELEKFSRAMAKAAEFSTQGSKVLDGMGVSLKGMSTNAAFYKIADLFAQMEDGATKTALATELFGKQGVALIPMLNQGSEALKGMAENSSKLGLAMSGEVFDATGKLADGFQVLVEQSKNLATLGLLPIIDRLGNLIEMINNVRAAGAGMFDGIYASIRGLNNATDDVNSRIEQAKQQMERTPMAAETIKQQIKDLEKVRDAYKGVAENTTKAQTETKKSETVTKAAAKSLASLGDSGKKAAGGVKSIADTMKDYADSVKKAQQDIGLIAQKQELLSTMLASGAISAQSFRNEMKKLTDATTAFNEAAGTNPLNDFTRDALKSQKDLDLIPEKLKIISDLLESGKISGQAFTSMKDSLGLAKSSLVEFGEQAIQAQRDFEEIPNKVELLKRLLSDGLISQDVFNSMNDGLKQTKSTLDEIGVAVGQSLQQGVAGMVDAFFQADQSFKTFASNFLKSIAKMIAQTVILKSLQTALGGTAFGDFLGIKANAKGGAYAALGLPQGVYNSPTFFNYGQAQHLTKFAKGGVFSQRMGVLGEAGPEAILPLRRTSQGKLGVSASPVVVNVNNSNGDNQVKVQESTKQDGSKQIDIMIRKKVGEMFGDGSMDKTFQRRFGISPRPL